jgi:hypothetical protein
MDRRVQLSIPGYEDGPDASIPVGILRIGHIYFAHVNGEIYSETACN